MRRIRVLVVGVVAVATMSLGTAACTPQDQANAVATVEILFHALESIIGVSLLGLLCWASNPTGGCL